MQQDEAQRFLDRTGVLRNACDLDLLIFFARHPRTLLSSETVATFLGYELKDIAESLEILLAGGLLHRKQSAAHAARLYVLADPGTHQEWIGSLVEVASTRPGRLVLKEALRRKRESSNGPVGAARNQTTAQFDRRSRVNVRRARRRGGR